MNNIKSLIAALAFAGLTACADNSPRTFSGFITDASMNTVTVRALTDESTCTFATTAADKSDANGLLLGAPVTVDYTGKLKDGAAATKIATDPTYAEAVGKWTMPDPIAPEGVMGVEIMVEGAARSINMATLVYTSWELQGEADKILLKGQSLGNGQTIDFTQTVRDRQNGRRKTTPSQSRARARSTPRPSSKQLSAPKASASGLPGALSFPGGSGVRFSPKIAAPTLAKSVLNA